MSAEDLIEVILTSGEAFVVPPLSPPKEEPVVVSNSTAEDITNLTDNTVVEPSESAPGSDKWKEEYDAQVKAWRRQSAEYREKSEQERARWEAIRKEETEKRKAAGLPEEKGSDIPTGLPTHRPKSISGSEAISNSVVDVRPESREDTDGSQKWEEVQASTSSFPSMSFPERTQTPSPINAPSAPQQPPASATTAIFNTTLSTRTRVVALFSALAINLALPFVNGVMLGFGEIFAKNVIMQWFGWSSGPAVANVGVRASRERQKLFR
ncbi:hypothetical protein FA15DRAFT_666708 [Coprinopsis marcescibilis]|uniref:TOM13-domain-containing protein n=1 Tax=Coprinopsis marcescibilis TaxID=230819 RepID=A0A5C3LFD1_COPMA|nr:hypothetical protein FA15DRAFT_666708 [Coprinopsis marcescibilis]